VRPDAKPSDLSQPGHIFPLMAQPGGVLTRAGHTEAASDLACSRAWSRPACWSRSSTRTAAWRAGPELEVFAREHGLKIGDRRPDPPSARHRTHDRAHRRTRGRHRSRPFRLVTYRDRIAHELHFALVRGTPIRGHALLVRVQVQNPLSRPAALAPHDLGVAATDALARDRVPRRACWWCWPSAQRSRGGAGAPARAGAAPAGRRGEWRRNGAGAQILADLGLRRLRVLGTPRRRSAWPASGWKWWSTPSLPAEAR
jgi:3,4-dihydroxy 2-butanone 4-phosphate synthase/GTP cyclohydrolase II